MCLVSCIANSWTLPHPGCNLLLVLNPKSLGFCIRYFVAFSFDTTLGVSIAIAFHKAAVKWAKQEAARQQPDSITWQKALAECGSYGKVMSCTLYRRTFSQGYSILLVCR